MHMATVCCTVTFLWHKQKKYCANCLKIMGKLYLWRYSVEAYFKFSWICTMVLLDYLSWPDCVYTAMVNIWCSTGKYHRLLGYLLLCQYSIYIVSIDIISIDISSLVRISLINAMVVYDPVLNHKFPHSHTQIAENLTAAKHYSISEPGDGLLYIRSLIDGIFLFEVFSHSVTHIQARHQTGKQFFQSHRSA